MMGQRGEGWVILQLLLTGATLVAPADKEAALPWWAQALGMLMVILGTAAALAAVPSLGRNLTPLPKPVENGELVTSGAYGVVRHPIYAGLLLAMAGWSLFRGTPVGFGLSLLLLLLFDAKSRREEQWLVEKYPGYAQYQRDVKKLIPWLY